jgi:hypothetical protein
VTGCWCAGAACVGVFSVQRLPRGGPQLATAAAGVAAVGLQLLSLQANTIIGERRRSRVPACRARAL